MENTKTTNNTQEAQILYIYYPCFSSYFYTLFNRIQER